MSFTPLTLVVKFVFGGKSKVGTKVRMRLFKPSEVVPAIRPEGPVRVITAPGWTASSKLSRRGERPSTWEAPFSGVKLSRTGGRWSLVVKEALKSTGRLRPTRSRGPRLVTAPTAFFNSPSTAMS